jgi:hypothetical protein
MPNFMTVKFGPTKSTEKPSFLLNLTDFFVVSRRYSLQFS